MVLEQAVENGSPKAVDVITAHRVSLVAAQINLPSSRRLSDEW
jgi:hypothetical protein